MSLSLLAGRTINDLITLPFRKLIFRDLCCLFFVCLSFQTHFSRYLANQIGEDPDEMLIEHSISLKFLWSEKGRCGMQIIGNANYRECKS